MVQNEASIQAKHDILYEKLNQDPSSADGLVEGMQELKARLDSLRKAIWEVKRQCHRARLFDTRRRSEACYICPCSTRQLAYVRLFTE
ncbi:hypothetical protein BO71DRAFT_467124 [Aspergillus ellipticus CBS 707.79]|uniref:Uncharacterized protein n=1 Tax=Aspergillus ellipticus CBS 707.79 TaxID=1448320 RepID=A0A319CU16_9EURO|nr:hypothetical protein BO71DRAFT_467124 [Aspergillus ellipticus CBS 707.79]